MIYGSFKIYPVKAIFCGMRSGNYLLDTEFPISYNFTEFEILIRISKDRKFKHYKFYPRA